MRRVADDALAHQERALADGARTGDGCPRDAHRTAEVSGGNVAAAKVVLTPICVSHIDTARGPAGATRRGSWHVRGRVERFLEPALLLLLAEQPAHGYELVDRVAELVPGERPELGGLYRVLRALEEDGLVTSEWDAAEPGPAKRRYELTPAGRELLRAWAKALKQTQSRRGRLSRTARREVNMHGHHHHRRGFRGRRFGRRWYSGENVLERLESYQRDLEQELADVSDLIRRLRETESAPERAAADRDRLVDPGHVPGTVPGTWPA